MTTNLIGHSVCIHSLIREESNTSFIGLLKKHIPRPGWFYIKVRDNIIFAKVPHPDRVIYILKDAKDKVKVGGVLRWSLMEMVEYHGHERGEWQLQP